MTDLQKMTSWNGKRPWDVATLCCSLCLTQVCQTLKSFLSKWLTLLLLALTLLRHPTMSYGAQTQEMYLRICPQWVYPGTTSTLRCKYRGNGQTTKKQSAPLTPPVEEPTKQQQRTSRKKMAYSIYTKCVPTGMGIPIPLC